MPTDTQILPLDPSAVEEYPLAADYRLREDRCVVELSIRPLGRPVLRGRLTATDGHFDLTGQGDGHQLALTMTAVSLRTNVPLLHKVLTGRTALRAADFAEIAFTSSDIILDENRALDIVGQVELCGMTREVRLRGDIRHADAASVVVWAAGSLPAPRRKPRGIGRLASLLAKRRIHLEIAVEFTR
ncbi:MAG: hypothetical protein JWQ81_3414 [Amycolatopsis sp.]|jgi:polyisoprenoid-binding protein YceI|uniref:YceI family protein n=1 Tax=Amycolatopsis sp. TaxID=37632 RepID=UPI00261C4DAA|nr:YceI family protein [Amycolatopsis sp.]MCU1682675.1 hypothetical protein [Amycolatopsis sp.]